MKGETFIIEIEKIKQNGKSFLLRLGYLAPVIYGLGPIQYFFVSVLKFNVWAVMLITIPMLIALILVLFSSRNTIKLLHLPFTVFLALACLSTIHDTPNVSLGAIVILVLFGLNIIFNAGILWLMNAFYLHYLAEIYLSADLLNNTVILTVLMAIGLIIGITIAILIFASRYLAKYKKYLILAKNSLGRRTYLILYVHLWLQTVLGILAINYSDGAFSLILVGFILGYIFLAVYIIDNISLYLELEAIRSKYHDKPLYPLNLLPLENLNEKPSAEILKITELMKLKRICRNACTYSTRKLSAIAISHTQTSDCSAILVSYIKSLKNELREEPKITKKIKTGEVHFLVINEEKIKGISNKDVIIVFRKT